MHNQDRLYTENILLESGPRFQHYLPETALNIEDLQLEFIKMGKTQRIVQDW